MCSHRLLELLLSRSPSSLLSNGFELPGAAPSADTAFKDVAYDVTIAATQTFNNGQYGHSIATRGPGTEAKAAIESKIAGYRAALADVQPLTNRRTNFLRIVGPHIECRGWPTFATFAMAPTGVVVAGSQTRVVQQQI